MARVAVIGAGLAGISAALRLSSYNHEVLLFESTAIPGGRGTSREQRRWVIDSGPHLLTLGGPLHKLVKRVAKGSFPLDRISPATIAIVHQSHRKPMPITASFLRRDKSLSIDEKKELLNIRKRVNQAPKHEPNLTINELKDGVSEKAWEAAKNIITISCGLTEFDGVRVNILAERIDAFWSGRLRHIREGWRGMIGRLLYSLGGVGVRVATEMRADELRFENGKAKAVLAEGEQFKVDAVIIATHRKEANRLLGSFHQLGEYKGKSEVTVWDLGLRGNPMRPHSMLLDPSRRVMLASRTPPPINQEVEEERIGWTLLQGVAWGGGKEGEASQSAEERLQGMLDEQCLGWAGMVDIERKSKRVEMTPFIDETTQRVAGEILAKSGVWLAGDWVESDHWLSDGAVVSGLKAGEICHRSLQK